MTEKRHVAKVYNGDAEYTFKADQGRFIEAQSIGGGVIELRSVKYIGVHVKSHEKLGFFSGDTAITLEWEEV